jgi:hypothetical protein
LGTNLTGALGRTQSTRKVRVFDKNQKDFLTYFIALVAAGSHSTKRQLQATIG